MTIFPHTLWHGTSAHLLPMIEEYGLGGRDVMADWRVMEFLNWGFPLLRFDENDYSDPDFIDLLPIRAAVTGGAAGMNFVYGDVYTTGGYDKAAIYAQTAPELLAFVRTIIEIAKERGIDAVPDGLRRYPEIADFLSLDPKPVVLKLPPVPLSSVQSESGGEAFIAEIGDRAILEAMLPQLAFRVHSVIPLSEIKVLGAVGQHAG